MVLTLLRELGTDPRTTTTCSGYRPTRTNLALHRPPTEPSTNLLPTLDLETETATATEEAPLVQALNKTNNKPTRNQRSNCPKRRRQTRSSCLPHNVGIPYWTTSEMCLGNFIRDSRQITKLVGRRVRCFFRSSIIDCIRNILPAAWENWEECMLSECCWYLSTWTTMKST